jgi:hypothetical protein
MQHIFLVALAATSLYAHGTCPVAAPSTGSVPILTTSAAAAVPAVTLAAERVGSVPNRRTLGGHCSLALLSPGAPVEARAAAYLPRSVASSSDDVPQPWGCYALLPRVHGAAGSDGTQAACAPFPIVDALPEPNPFL